MCLYVIHVDLIEPFCRFQPKKERFFWAARFSLVLGWFTINAKNLDSGYSSFQTAKLVNA